MSDSRSLNQLQLSQAELTVFPPAGCDTCRNPHNSALDILSERQGKGPGQRGWTALGSGNDLEDVGVAVQAERLEFTS